MRKLFLLTILIAFLNAFCFAQFKASSWADSDDYLRKSRNQKKAAWILAGAGAALIIAGAVIPRGDVEGIDFYTWSDSYENDDLKAALILGGLLAGGGSIPLFIAGGRNKRKASKASMGFKNERIYLLQNKTIARGSQPSLNIKIML